MPLDPVLNLEGYYINIVDKIRRWLSQEQRVAFKDILAKIDRIPNKDTDRIILTMDSGIILDMPPKMTERDYEILFAQINVLLMRFDDSLKMVAQTRTSVS
jgi:hypothetical protein